MLNFEGLIVGIASLWSTCEARKKKSLFRVRQEAVAATLANLRPISSLSPNRASLGYNHISHEKPESEWIEN